MLPPCEYGASGPTPDLRTACAGFARRLREQTDYDLLLMPALVLRLARVRHHWAYWDGARRPLDFPRHVLQGANLFRPGEARDSAVP